MNASVCLRSGCGTRLHAAYKGHLLPCPYTSLSSTPCPAKHAHVAVAEACSSVFSVACVYVGQLEIYLEIFVCVLIFLGQVLSHSVLS